MPELPEVETIVSELRSAGLAGRRIESVRVNWPPLLSGLSPAVFRRRVLRSRIRGIFRRGKFIVISLSNGFCILVHLRMSGRFILCPAGRAVDKHEHAVLALGGCREIRYHDTRKFGRWLLTDDPGRILGALGPEPLGSSFTARQFSALLASRRRRLKPLLMDQRFLAGLGNIYADEALWESRIHPLRQSDSLTPEEAERLFAAIRTVLRRGIRNKGTSLGSGDGNYARPTAGLGDNRSSLRVSRKRGGHCPRCGGPISRIIAGQRATYFCASCQKEEGTEAQRTEGNRRRK